MKVTMLAEGLGWPEGPTKLPDGSLAFVEAYRGQVSVLTKTGVKQHAYVGGGPNAVLAADDGYLYVTQNGGIVGPWRAKDQRPPSIQRISPDGKVEVMFTEIGGITLKAPNDLAFTPDGRLIFTDPGGEWDPKSPPDPSYLFAINPDGTAKLLEQLPATYPNGIAIEADGSIVWVESFTRAVMRRTTAGKISRIATLPQTSVPDGFKIAANGNYYIATLPSNGVDIVSPDGQHVGLLKVGKAPTNCLFDGSTLYVTDGGHLGLSADPPLEGYLWAVELDGVEGKKLFPGRIAH